MPYNERIGDAAQRTLNENPQNINNIWLESENSEVEIKAVFLQSRWFLFLQAIHYEVVRNS